MSKKSLQRKRRFLAIHDESSDSSDSSESMQVLIEEPRRMWRDMSSSKSTIFRSGARVTFFSDVTPSSTARMLMLVEEAADLIIIGRSSEIPTFKDGCVELLIASNGGDAISGLTAYDALQRCNVPVRGIVSGSCSSAATLILLGCTERCAQSHSFMLLHNIRTVFSGSCTEARVDISNAEMISHAYQSIYKQHSSMSTEQIIQEMSTEGFLTAPKALALGLIERVLGPVRSVPRGQRMPFLTIATL
jgi:ATP-dependent protease ClpP protease subunit